MFRKLITGLTLACALPSLALAGGDWRDGPSLLAPRSGLAAAELDGRIYAAGGAGLTQPRSEVEVYDPRIGDWRDVMPLPAGLERFGLTAANGRLYAAGGYAAREGVRPIADMWSFDPAGGVWQRETPMPGPKASFQLVATDTHLYALGGETGTPGLFVFDIEAREWETIDVSDDISRRGAAALMIEDRIYFLGGARRGMAAARVDIYDTQTGEWSRGTDMPTPRAGHAAAYIDGEIHIFGGRGANLSQTLSDHISYNVANDVWSVESELRTPRTDATAVSLDGEVYLVGGGAGGGFFAPFTAVDVTDIFVPASD